METQDELCECNHTIRQHVTKLIGNPEGKDIREMHCDVVGCLCKKFKPQKGCGKRFEHEYYDESICGGVTDFWVEETKSIIEGFLLCPLCQDQSPSQQTSVDKREVVHIKKTSDVGENPISDTSNLSEHIRPAKMTHPENDVIFIVYVRDFIKRLKEDLQSDIRKFRRDDAYDSGYADALENIIEHINKRAGKELVE